jgi:hypothetical protein
MMEAYYKDKQIIFWRNISMLFYNNIKIKIYKKYLKI